MHDFNSQKHRITDKYDQIKSDVYKDLKYIESEMYINPEDDREKSRSLLKQQNKEARDNLDFGVTRHPEYYSRKFGQREGSKLQMKMHKM